MGSGTGLPIDGISSQKERDDRMWSALVDVGPAVSSYIELFPELTLYFIGIVRDNFHEVNRRFCISPHSFEVIRSMFSSISLTRYLNTSGRYIISACGSRSSYQALYMA